MAAIVGTELTEQHLLPTFNLFLNDVDEVRIGVIRHMTKFLGVLSPETRETYLDMLKEMQKQIDNWRYRKLLAKYV